MGLFNKKKLYSIITSTAYDEMIEAHWYTEKYYNIETKEEAERLKEEIRQKVINKEVEDIHDWHFFNWGMVVDVWISEHN